MTFPSKLMIGTYAGGTAGMVAVENLGGTGLGIKTFSVEIVPVHYSRIVKLGNGNYLGQGWKQAEWHLNGIRDSHWNTLYSSYRTGGNTQLYIRTLSEDAKTFANYLVNMVWPEGPPNRDHTTSVILDFTISFIQMVVQP